MSISVDRRALGTELRNGLAAVALTPSSAFPPAICAPPSLDEFRNLTYRGGYDSAGLQECGPRDIAIGPVVSTRVPCRSPVMCGEGGFLANLERISDLGITPGKPALTHHDGTSRGIMLFAASGERLGAAGE